MQNLYDYKKFAILYVDDEEKSLKYFQRTFGQTFTVLTAANAREGYQLLEQNRERIGLLLTDQRMPGEKGVQLLEKARQLCPRVLRILVTAYTDVEAAIDAVNTGAIYKYISKPWDANQLDMILRRALEFFIVQRERDYLLREKMSVLHNMMITDRIVSLGILASGLGHHIRNALVAVRTFLDLAPAKLEEEQVDLDELRNPNYWLDFYRHVQAQVQRITEMLTDLGVAVATPANLFQDRLNLAELLNEILQQLDGAFRQKQILLQNSVPPDLPLLVVDQRKFHRLFELLFTDEIAHLPPESQITLSATAVSNGVTESPDIQLSIQDNGPGLPEDSLRSVFDPFFLRHDNPQEFGLRLMTCFFIVYHHGGTIRVTSKPGEGTRFDLLLPTNPHQPKTRMDDESFLAKVLLNEALWEKLLASP